MTSSTQLNIISYLGQFLTQANETWQANSCTANTPTAIKNYVPMATHSSPGPTLLIQYFSDIQLKKG